MDFIQASHYTKGRNGKKIEGVVIHTMGGFFQGSVSWFKNPTTQASAHYLVGYGGETIQMVKDEDTAWQATNWDVNCKTIGIEHEDKLKPDDVRPDALYEASATLLADLSKKHNFPLDRQHVVKHSEVYSGKPNCPGKLDIDRIINRAREINNQVTPPQGGPATVTPTILTVTAAAGANIRTTPFTAERNILRAAPKGSSLPSDGKVTGALVAGSTEWWSIIGGGFIHSSTVTAAPQNVPTPPPPANDRTVNLPEREFINLGIKGKNFDIICGFFGIPEQERIDIGTGQRIVDEFQKVRFGNNQPQTSNLFLRIYNKLFVG